MVEKDLIFGAATSYSRERLLPFVASVGRNAPDCKLILLRYDDDDVIDFDDVHPAVEFLRVRRRFAFLNGAHSLLGRAAVQATIRICCSLGISLDKVLLIHCYRFVKLASLLRMDAFGRVGRIAIIDAADVIVQSDPFVGVGNEVLLAEEEWLGKDEPTNRHWYESLPTDPATKEALLNAPVICCGVVVGSASAMQEFCEMLTAKLRWAGARIGSRVMDQPLVNLLARQDGRGLFRVLPEANEHIVHLGPAWNDRFAWHASRGVVNAAGHPIAIVHQYDRKLLLVGAVGKMLGVKCFPHPHAK